MQHQYSFEDMFVFRPLEKKALAGDRTHGTVDVDQHRQLLGEVDFGSALADKAI